VRALLPCIALLAISAQAYGADASSPSGQQVLEDCSKAHWDPSPGLDNLRQPCPGLEQALLDLGLAEQLGPHWRDAISGPALANLARLTRRYQGEPVGTAPQLEALSSIMQSVRVEPQPTTWWQRFKHWLSSLLRRRPEDRESWLRHLDLPWKPSEQLARVIGYASIAIVVLLALWVVWREVRAAYTPLSPARRRRPLKPTSVPDLSDDIGLPQLQSLPPQVRPAALLAALVGALRRSGRLDLERALTHRQLGARASFDDAAQRARFVRVALLAERCLYGVPESMPAELVADAVALHAQLSAPRARPA
jgi:hypothetical protein